MPFAPEQERNRTLATLCEACQSHTAVQALWLQGSLGRGDADAQSDIDACVAVDDEAVEAFVADREGFLRSLGQVIVWTDLAKPGLCCVRALDANGVALDLIIEPNSTIEEAQLPGFKVLFDKNGVAARLRGGWTASQGDIGRAVSRASLSAIPNCCSTMPSSRTPPSDVMHPPSKAAVSFVRPMAGILNGGGISSGMAQCVRADRMGRHPILERCQRVTRHPPANSCCAVNRMG